MGWNWYPPASKPRPADGIKAKARKGEIGSTWWSQHFLDVLKSIGLGSRLQRGRSYARAGQVLDLEIKSGEVTARVQGSRAAPYKVSIHALPLPEKDWARVEDAMASRAVFLAKLLAGEMPRDVEEAFAACKTTLFPTSSRDLSTDCSCPDWANPCKHIAAVFYILAESFDEDPFEIFAWRGRTRDQLLGSLRSREGAPLASAPVGGGPGAGGWALPLVDAPDLAETAKLAGDFYGSPAHLPALGRRLPPQPAAPDAILMGLDELALRVGGQPFTTVLAGAYPIMTAYARSKLLSEGETGPAVDDP